MPIRIVVGHGVQDTAVRQGDNIIACLVGLGAEFAGIFHLDSVKPTCLLPCRLVFFYQHTVGVELHDSLGKILVEAGVFH